MSHTMGPFHFTMPPPNLPVFFKSGGEIVSACISWCALLFPNDKSTLSGADYILSD